MAPDLIEGALIALGAFLAGQWLPRPRRRRLKPPGAVKAVCGCGHHHSYHDPETGACHGQDAHYQFDPKIGDRKQVFTACTCRQYSGPEPLPEYYAPEISQ